MQFETETEAALGLPPKVHFLCPAADRLSDGQGSGQFAVFRSLISSTKTDGASLTGICSGSIALCDFAEVCCFHHAALSARMVSNRR